jgi:2-C-methyl-D-erythritol 4-phosphate cytidylyltransferase
VASDEAGLLERMGESVRIIPGEERNIKITTRFDFRLAEMLLQERVLL